MNYSVKLQLIDESGRVVDEKEFVLEDAIMGFGDGEYSDGDLGGD